MVWWKNTVGRLWKRKDLVIILIVVLVAGIGILFLRLGAKPGSQVRVSMNGAVIGVYSLSEETEIPIYCSENDYNILVLADGTACMRTANCPDKLCVKHRKIRHLGETIVCLPHRIVVEVIDGTPADIDGITY